MSESIEDSLRSAIRQSRQTHYEIWRSTGVHYASIDRFVRRERSLRLDVAAKIAKHLGLVLKQEKQ